MNFLFERKPRVSIDLPSALQNIPFTFVSPHPHPQHQAPRTPHQKPRREKKRGEVDQLKLTSRHLPHASLAHAEPVAGHRGRDATGQHVKAHVHLLAALRLLRGRGGQLDDPGSEERQAEELRVAEGGVLDLTGRDGGSGVGDF